MQVIKKLIICNLFLVLTLGKYINISLNFHEPSEIIDNLESQKMDENFYINSKKYLVQLLERYVYLDILKNPPQPESQEYDYFEKVDLIKEIENIDIKDTNFYEFYRKIRTIFGKARDNHFQILFNRTKTFPYIFNELYFINPIKFTIDSSKKVYAKINSIYPTEVLREFSSEKIDFIYSNENIEISQINNIDPIDFIQNFKDSFNYLHNKNARFSYNLNRFGYGLLAQYPLSLEELENLTITYSTGENITMGFKIFERENLVNYFAQKFSIDVDTLSNFIDGYEKLRPVMTLFEILKEYEKTFIINNYDLKDNNNNNTIKWDFELPHGVQKCRKDDINQINVYYQNSFQVDNESDYLIYLENCTSLFDTNSYPIVVIEDHNLGGMVCFTFLEAVQPRIEMMLFASYRNSTIHIDRGLYDFEKCNRVDKEVPFDYLITDDYGNGIKHIRTKELIASLNKEERFYISQVKNKIKNRRKPTEIIVFTDGFSYSCTSFFIKGLQQYGGGIIVGYNGNPNMNKNTFDAAQSPAAPLQKKEEFDDDASKNLTELGYQIFCVTYKESFDVFVNNKSEIHLPREFKVDLVDERVPIYSRYNDDIYDNFMKEANKIFNKYKTNCNSRNKRILLDNIECDKKLEEHTHGGLLCGNGNEWTSKCVPYYCDSGFYFDSLLKKCIKNPCNSINNENFINYNISLFAIISIIFYLIL